MRPKIAFSLDEAQRAADEWGFNCGPAALCAVLGMSPEEIRPHLGDFESKRYTNPTLMRETLIRLRVEFSQTYRSDSPTGQAKVGFGLMRVQWAGPWTMPGVPMRARYRHTHWVGVDGGDIFDVNAMCVGGWTEWAEWSTVIVPWLIRECCPGGDGTWWPTHGIEIGGTRRQGLKMSAEEKVEVKA